MPALPPSRADAPALSAEDVIAAYRFILGREPESPDAIAYHQGHPSLSALRRALLSSDEFRALAEAAGETGGEAAPAGPRQVEPSPPEPGAGQGILLPVNSVETEAEGAGRAALWSRVAATWAELGRTAAHWSVLTHDAYRPETLEENRAAFEASAAVEGLLVDAALERLPGTDPASMHCVEIGCGVGRATRALAARFAHVTGYDISPAHLEIAGRELAAAGHDNVTLRQVATVEDYAAITAADLFYSRIVLQHNPPPVQAEILRHVLAGLNPGGIALFQVVTHGIGYDYGLARDLRRKAKGMEMHVLPQPVVFALLAEAGLRPVEVQEDHAAGDGPFRSHLFLAQKT